MADLDEARTTGDSAADHVADHNTLHEMHNVFDGSWLHHLFDREAYGETEHANDQEFKGTSVSGTEVAPSGSVTWTQKGSRLRAEFSGQSASDVTCRLYSLTPSSAPVTIEAAMQLHQWVPTDYGMMGLCFTDGTATSSNIVTAFTYPRNGDTSFMDISGFTGTITNVSTAEDNIALENFQQQLSGLIYLRLFWTAANTFEAQYSLDGTIWTNIDSSISKTMTPTHIGVLVSAWGDPSTCRASFEYLRVTESDLS